MAETAQNQWGYVGGAVLLHALLAAGLYLLAMASSSEPPEAPQLAIQAFVVQSFPAPPRVDKARLERERLAAEQLAQERAKAELEQQERERQERDAVAARELEAQKTKEAEVRREQAQAEEARLAAVKREREVAEREAAERKAREVEAERKRKEAAEQQRLAEIQRQREAAERREQEAREAEFRSNLAAEEERMQVASSGKMNEYIALIEASIVSKWIRPPSARVGLECEVKVSQAESGTVLSVRIGTCNGGDTAVRQSIEAAVYRASPLPPPPDPRLFDRNLRVLFRPRD